MKLIHRKLWPFALMYLGTHFANAQQGPLRFPSPFGKNNTESILLKTSSFIPDSTLISLAPIQFRQKEKSDFKLLFLALSNSGGMIAFSDSLLIKPIFLEKRSAFPFRPFKPNQHIRIEYTCKPGSGDYLGFRLFEVNSNLLILDEVLICSSGCTEEILFEGCSGWISLK